MKKFLLILCIVLFGLSVNAEILIDESNVTMDNIWLKLGKREQKINEVGARILNRNQIPKRVSFYLYKSPIKSINAFASYRDKSVNIYPELLNYVDNDDELAAILSHEIAHNIDFYDGFGKLIVMKFNSKAYEYKADEKGIDYMVKAGYNPIAMITVMNKIGGESIFDWGTFTSHPKTSARLMKDYEYIYKKYPNYLNSQMAKNVYYVNWYNTASKDINNFQQKEKRRAEKRGNL